MLRAAYDISIVCSRFNWSASKTGVFRVVEEMLKEINSNSTIDLSTVAMCNSDPCAFNKLAELYLRSHCDTQSYKLIDGFKSRFRLTEHVKHFNQMFDASTIESYEKAKRRTDFLSFSKIASKIFRKIDVYPFLETSDIDIFHSPFCELPDVKYTGAIPRLITVYDLIPITAPQFVLPKHRLFFEKILNSIKIHQDWVACISEHTRNEFCEYTGMSPERVFVTPLATAHHFQRINNKVVLKRVREAYGISNKNYFLSVGTHLEPRKNLSHLVKCFRRLVAENPDFDFDLVIVGSTGEMSDCVLKDTREKDKFKERVIFTGYVPDSHLSAIYSGAKAFVYPSLYEGFGLPPLEAMKCGVPVITSNTTSLPEVVGSAGIMIDPKNEDDLCQAMYLLWKDSGLSYDLSCRGLERSEQFTWKKCANKTIDLYQKIIRA